jgi:hypothetical protein
VSAAETERLRRAHREAVAAAKTVPDFAKRLELLQRCDEAARRIRQIETRAERK